MLSIWRNCFILGLGLLSLPAADWPQWRGPHRTGHAPAGETLSTLPTEPKTTWSIPASEGLSSPVVAAGRVFHFEAENGREVLRALDVRDGKRLWSAIIDETFSDSQGPAGPRCTPVVDGDAVYAVSCKGELQCLETATGKLLWRANYVKDFGAVFIGEKGSIPGAARHGNNGSPLIDGPHLFACAGGTNGAGVVCLEKRTGKVIWKSLDEQAAYAPPVLANVAGLRQLICFMADSLLALDPADGRLLWRFPIKTAFARHVTTPVAFDDLVVVSSHQVGLLGVRVARTGRDFTATQAWLSKEAAMNFASPVAIGKNLYGLGPQKDLLCVDIPTGRLQWSKPGYFNTSADKAHGAFIAFANSILALTDSGQLVLFAADESAFKELGTAQISALNWCNPAWSNGQLFARDGIKTGGELRSISLR